MGKLFPISNYPYAGPYFAGLHDLPAVQGMKAKGE
jgi:hypothetical protein